MNENQIGRREFVKIVTAAGAGSMLGAPSLFAQAAAPATGASEPVPKRPFGKTGVNVSMLALGGIFDITANQLVVQRALDHGVTYWDTANGYTNGNSERGIGMYLEKYPEVRKRIFLVTKAGGPHTPTALDQMIEESFRRMKTDYVDLFFLHGIGSARELTPEIKDWAEKKKAANKLRFFGFSSHGNMEHSLADAAKLGWIDGIMLKYDFRLMHTDAMRAAMDACAQAGIGLTAMKTQGGGPVQTGTEEDLKLAGHFVKRGFTDKQAKLKAVWENSQIASICSQMGSVGVLESNVAAAHDKTSLSAADHQALGEFASRTRGQYCAGCGRLCEAAVGFQAPLADLMRCLMYERTYGDRDLAMATWSQLPERARATLATLDFAAAERACPHGLPIASLARDAARLMA